MAVVFQCIFLSLTLFFKIDRLYFNLQYTAKQSFGVCLQINCLVTFKAQAISILDSFF